MRGAGTTAVVLLAASGVSASWGAGDELGAANYLSQVDRATLSKYLTASSKSYSLGLDVRHDDPAFGTRQCVMFVTHSAIGEATYFDDFYLPCANGVASQLDGLGHLGTDGIYYNGFTKDQMMETGTVANLAYNRTDASPLLAALPQTLNYGYLKHLGVDKVPPFFTRVIVLNMPNVFQDTAPETLEQIDNNTYIKGGTAIGEEHIKAALLKQGLQIKKGDVVLLHTGWMHLFRNDPKFLSPMAEPGISMSGARFLVSKEVTAVGSDSWGLEVYPNPVDEGVFPAHQYLIKETGTYILENMDTRAMVADGVDEALFVLGHIKIRGAVQALINPVAIGGNAGTIVAAGNNWNSHQFKSRDELGAANYLAEVDRSELARHVSTASKTYSLGLDVRHDDQAFGTRQCAMFITHHAIGEATYFDDFYVPCANGVASQIDGLGHLGTDGVYYNGFTHSEMVQSGTVANLAYNNSDAAPALAALPPTLNYSYLTHLSVDKLPPFVTRAIVLNMVDVFRDTAPEVLERIGSNRYLKGGTAIDETHIQAALQKQGLQIKKGDIILLYTGWMNLFRNTNKFLSPLAEPGLSMSGARFLVSKKVVAIGADAWGLEAYPTKEPDTGVFPVHQYLLKEQGTYILENMDTRAMVADGVDEALFVLGQVRIRGAVQALINPVAIGCSGACHSDGGDDAFPKWGIALCVVLPVLALGGAGAAVFLLRNTEAKSKPRFDGDPKAAVKHQVQEVPKPSPQKALPKSDDVGSEVKKSEPALGAASRPDQPIALGIP